MSEATERGSGGGMDRAEEQRLVKLAAKGDHDAATAHRSGSGAEGRAATEEGEGGAAVICFITT